MNDQSERFSEAPVQDRDLLLRLSLYFDTLDSRLREGQGWFIFNVDGSRSGRVARLIQQRLDDCSPPVDSLVLSWRDFALSAYVMEVGLPGLEPVAKSNSGSARARKEFEFASRVTTEVWDRLEQCDLVVVAGVQPKFEHEIVVLDRAIDKRFRDRRATILMSPSMPHRLQEDVGTSTLGRDLWDRVFTRMYQSSLVAL